MSGLGFCFKGIQLKEMNSLIGIITSTINPYHIVEKVLLASLGENICVPTHSLLYQEASGWIRQEGRRSQNHC